jgi:cardiolipin synthase
MTNASSTGPADRYRPNILTIANQLTILRIICVPVFITLLIYDRIGAALIVFVAAAITDGLDGLIARRFGQKTSVGAILDPIADKLLVSCSIILLAVPQMGFTNPIPIWLAALIIFRDAFILLGSLAFFLIHGFRIFRPSFYGKMSTLLQLVTVCVVLIYEWMTVRQEALYFLFILTGLVTAVSGIQYIARGWDLIEE